MSETHWSHGDFSHVPQEWPQSDQNPVHAAEEIDPSAPRPFPELTQLLQHSPNNPDYLDSDTYRQYDEWLKKHEHAVHDLLSVAIPELGFEHAEDDVERLKTLRAGESWRIDGDPKKSLHGVYLAAYIAYPEATQEIVDQFNATSPEDGAMKINNLAVRAIGATMLRAEYMDKLAYRFPDMRQLSGEAPFQPIFRQNVLAIIQRASWLDSLAQPSPETPELHLVE